MKQLRVLVIGITTLFIWTGTLHAEGISWTGLPLISFNSDDGFGYGARVIATQPDATLKPFKYQIWGQYYKTTKGRENHEVKFDILDFLGTGLRFKVQGGFVRFNSAQYYGLGNYQDIQKNTAIRKGELPINENIPSVRDFYQINEWNEELTLNQNFATSQGLDGINPGRRIIRERQNKFFLYDRVEPYGSIITEDFIGQSNFKWQLGYRLTRYRLDTFYGDFDDGEGEPNSRTLIDIDRPHGYDATERRKYVSLPRVGFIYDSRPRDREKDPNSGIFSDIHYVGSGKGTGSDYSFQKVTLTWRHYIEVGHGFFHAMGQEMVLAYRFQGHETFGDAPFYELEKVYSAEETARGLGGGYGLRGYPSGQFVDKVMAMANGEMRYTFAKTGFLGGMNFVALAYYDIGQVAPTRAELSMDRGFHKAWGGGIRMIWKKNTVVNISHGFSAYEAYTAFDFGHMF